MEFLTEQTFLTCIKNMVKEKNMDYMEAVIHFCDMNKIDVEEVLPLIGRTLKEKIRVDAENGGYMKTKSARLPM